MKIYASQYSEYSVDDFIGEDAWVEALIDSRFLYYARFLGISGDGSIKMNLAPINLVRRALSGGGAVDYCHMYDECNYSIDAIRICEPLEVCSTDEIFDTDKLNLFERLVGMNVWVKCHCRYDNTTESYLNIRDVEYGGAYYRRLNPEWLSSMDALTDIKRWTAKLNNIIWSDLFDLDIVEPMETLTTEQLFGKELMEAYNL